MEGYTWLTRTLTSLPLPLPLPLPSQATELFNWLSTPVESSKLSTSFTMISTYTSESVRRRLQSVPSWVNIFMLLVLGLFMLFLLRVLKKMNETWGKMMQVTISFPTIPYYPPTIPLLSPTIPYYSPTIPLRFPFYSPTIPLLFPTNPLLFPYYSPTIPRLIPYSLTKP